MNPRPAHLPEASFGKRVSALFALAALLIVGTAICSYEAGVAPVDHLQVSIREGRFVPTTQAATSSLQAQPVVQAGRPIALTFVSHDYVYTVQQPDTNTAVVVLPGATANMSVTLHSGNWPIKLVQGCGRLSKQHAGSLILNAVE